MTRMCAWGLSAVVLSFALAPAPGLAAREKRPFKASLTGNAHPTPTDAPFVRRNGETAEGEATRLGRCAWAGVQDAGFAEIPDGVAVVATFTMTAANGDELYGEFTSVG